MSCVAKAVVIGRPPFPPDASHTLTLSEDPAPLGRELLLSVRHRCTLADVGSGADRWELRTVGYSYRLSDADDRELVIYQWDPDPASRSPVDHPHLHIGRSVAHPTLPPGFRERIERLVKAHLPTGFVMLPAVLRVAIEDFGVEPSRPDWDSVLHAANAVGGSSFTPGTVRS